jgi:hypothetical protein
MPVDWEIDRELVKDLVRAGLAEVVLSYVHKVLRYSGRCHRVEPVLIEFMP